MILCKTPEFLAALLTAFPLQSNTTAGGLFLDCFALIDFFCCLLLSSALIEASLSIATGLQVAVGCRLSSDSLWHFGMGVMLLFEQTMWWELAVGLRMSVSVSDVVAGKPSQIYPCLK